MTRQRKTLTRSFAGGEMSPEMFGRMDDIQFQAGAETLLNMIPRPTGSAARRSGTKLVRQTKSSGSPFLFPFVFSQDQSLVVEAGRATIGGLDSGYFRFHSEGNTLLYGVKDEFYTSVIVIPRDLVHVTVAAGAPGTFTLNGHGLQVDDQLQLIATSTPSSSPQLVHGDQYFVRSVTSNTFTLKDSSGTQINISEQGFEVAFRGYDLTRAGGNGEHNSEDDYWFSTHYNTGRSGHNLKPGDEVFLTMEPYSTSHVGFDGSYFKLLAPVGSSTAPSTSGLSRDPDYLGQQVMFFGQDLPPNIEEGRPYYIIKNDSTSGGDPVFRISETRNGAPHGSGATGYTGSTVQSGSAMCAMPYGGDPGRQFYVGRSYWVTGGTSFKLGAFQLSSSPGQASAGEGTGMLYLGRGERRIHKVTSAGQIDSYQGKSYYLRKPLLDRSAYLTRNAHNQSNTRVPGVRTQADSADYWREQSGKSTGGNFPVSISRTAGGYLQVDSTAHGLEDGQAVTMVQGFVGVGGVDTIASGTTYYVLNKTADSFELETSVGNGAIALASPFAAGGVMMRGGVYFDASTDKVTWPAHGLSEADPVVFTKAEKTSIGELTVLLGNLELDKTYYVSGVATDDFKLSLTPYGVAIDLTGTFNSACVANGATYLEVAHDYTEAELPEISTTQSNDVLTMCSQLKPATELRRLGSYTWETRQITFKAVTPPPTALQETEANAGQVNRIYGIAQTRVSSEPTPAVYNSGVSGYASSSRNGYILYFSRDAGDPGSSTLVPNEGFYSKGDVIYVSGTEESVTLSYPTFKLKEDYYSVIGVLESGNSSNSIYAVYIANVDGTPIQEDQHLNGSNPLQVIDSADPANTSLNAVYTFGNPANQPGATPGEAFAVGPNARLRIASINEETDNTYVVTSIDANNEESEPSDPLTISNLLDVPGSFNRMSWTGSPTATRYRVYKKLSGIYGFIGETDETTFKDDNIGPDLAVAPPIVDDAMRKTATVTFDADGDFVSWQDHGLEAGMPVVFETTDFMPGLYEGRTYYVLNPESDTFQIAETATSEDAFNITGSDTGVHTAVAGLFPGATSYYEGRRVFGGSEFQPQDVFMSASGTEADISYSIPTVDSDRIYFRIAAREQSRVRHIVPVAQLMLLTDSTEYQVTPANDDILTPSSVSVRPQSFVGASYPQPALVNNTVVFSAARGGHVRELGYNASVLGYLTGDLSIRAAHLFDDFTIKDMAYQKAPLPIVWCVSSSGKLLGLTYVPEEQVGAWHQHTTTDGTFESVVCVPEGDEDAVYVIVKRGSNHYVERLADTYRGGTENIEDAFFVDSGVTYTGAATTTINGLAHLDGKTVAYLADGLPGTGTVDGGTLELSTAASKVHVGYPMTSQIKTLPMTMLNVDAFGTGRTKNVNRVWARLFESAAFEVGPKTSSLRTSSVPAAGSLLSDFVEVTMPPSWTDEGQIVIQQDKPLPLTIAGMTLEVATGG
jgi:hypothetical protein